MRDPGYYTSTDYIEDGLHTFTQTLLIKIVAMLDYAQLLSYSTMQCKQHMISQPSCLMISFKRGNIHITARWLVSNVILNLPHIHQIV